MYRLLLCVFPLPVGEERAVMARLFDTTVADYTMGSPTFGKPIGNVLVGGGTRARSDDQVCVAQMQSTIGTKYSGTFSIIVHF